MKENAYWFLIEPYVYINMINDKALLYNTLDGNFLETEDSDILLLLKEMLKKNNSGIAYLKGEIYNRESVKSFIEDLRRYYMGDIIDTRLSDNKPIQLLPYCNFKYEHEVYKKQNFTPYSNILDKLFEINFHLDMLSSIEKFMPLLSSIPENICLRFSIQENCDESKYFRKFIETYPALKCLSFSYKNLPKVNLTSLKNIQNIQIRIIMDFPIDIVIWEKSKSIIDGFECAIEYVVDVRSEKEYDYFETFFHKNHIDAYQIRPTYTGENMDFFKKCVFLDKEDILSSDLSIKDIMANQAINIYDFGKINILENGDVYANIHHPKLGNIFEETIYELVQKEVDKGCSWFRIRNQHPCNQCLYQWLCPSPSDYELLLNRPNLCNICNKK